MDGFLSGRGFQLRFHRVQIIRTLRLFPGGQGVCLRAHILNFCQLQSAVFLGLRQSAAGIIGVDVNLEGLFVLPNHQAVSDAVQVCTQRFQ
ncbi:hypothetical protein SDC9_159333 [bioreactor metagenome]|uniref:Uncharacterized protein n=1 Tax=bioreactor metagenome TaxID=1076179 RepID=A0A645FIF5_9ZZZZ